MTYSKKLITKALAALLFLTAGLGWELRHLSAQAAANLYAAVGVSKTEVVPGGSVDVTLTLRNDGDIDFTDILLQGAFPAGLTYTTGTAKILYDLCPGGECPLADSWVSENSNVGSLPQGKEKRVRFSATVDSAATVGSRLEMVMQAKPTELTEWMSRADTITVISADQTTNLLGGDVFQAANNTTQVGWGDPIAAVMGNVIEYKMRITNYGAFDALNAQIYVQIPWDPQNPSTNLVSSATVTADNAATLSDTATVTLTGQPSYLWPKDGHYNFVGVTDLYNCPSGCALPKNFLWNPIPLGKILAGTAVEVLFKVDIVPIATPTPTPTSTPTPGPTATPVPLACRNIEIPGGTSRSQNTNVTFRCVGNPSSDVTQCRFRFGDGSSEVFEDDCETTHTYSTVGGYDVSCEVRDRSGSWQASNACGSHVEIVSGPTSTPRPDSGQAPVPTQAQVLSAAVPEEQPETGFNTIWLGVLAILGIGIKLLLAI